MNTDDTPDGSGGRQSFRPGGTAPAVDPQQVERVFSEAMERTAEELVAFLDARCADQPLLRREVEQLVHHASMSEQGFLATPPAPLLDAEEEEEAIEPGTLVAEKYRIERLLGRGGMGAVYLARQIAPLERDVAIKLVRPGLGSRGILSRFEQERRTLARLSHPNIAGVFDAGLVDRNQPFFAMEFVGEETLIEYAQSSGLTLEERINLFIDVCAAVQYAHQQGVIHRDLKPSNLLVARRADRAIVKVIDFGIAKVINRDLGDGVDFTQTLQPIGTPMYMSPEQATGERAVDTRSDIYALGAILYELLTGSPPIDRDRCRTSNISEVLRQIREESPVRPSQRVGSDRSRLRGELDWIIMKALANDPEDRYVSAWAFGQDLQRYLQREPVEAGPPSALYRLGKFASRHRAGVAAGLAVAAVLPLAMVIAISFAISEAEQRQAAESSAQRAVEEAQRAERATARALAAEADATRRAEELEKVVEFQASQLADLDTAVMGTRLRESIINHRRALLQSAAASGDDVSVAESEIEAELRLLDEAMEGINFTDIAVKVIDQNILARALAAVDEHFDGQPLVRARLLQTIASTLTGLGLFSDAMMPQQQSLELYQDELGGNDELTLSAWSNLAWLHQALGQLEQAEQIYIDVLEKRRSLYGDDDPRTLSSINSLGLLRHGQGRFAEAAAHYREALDGRRRVLGNEHPDTLASINNLGGLLQASGRLEEAEAHFREAAEQRRRVLGSDDRQTLTSINNVGNVLRARGNPEEAEVLYREAMETGRRTLGSEHPDTLVWINNVAAALIMQGQYEEAEPYLREAMEARIRVLGPNHPRTLVSINDMGYLLRAQGRSAEAESYYQRALTGFRSVLGDNHIHTIVTNRNIGMLLKSQGRYDEAEPYLREALNRRRVSLGEGHSHTIVSYLDVSDLLLQAGRPREVIDLLTPAIDAMRGESADVHDRALGRFLLTIGEAHLAENAFSPAEAALLEADRLLIANYGIEHEHANACATQLVRLYEEWDDAEPTAGYGDRAEPWRHRVTASAGNVADPTSARR